MRTLHQTLHLQHHRHTGRRLHHQHTSYRALVVIFIVAGAAMASIGAVNRAAADSFGVSAWVNIPVPGMPIIHSPVANTTVRGSSVLVMGSCPLVSPQALVSISVDNNPAGTGSCDSNNDFSVPVSLNSVTQQITATAIAISGRKGASSVPVTVTSQGAATPAAIDILADQPFMYVDGQSVTWTGTIGTSGSEYVHLDWGDNSQSNYTVQAGTQQFTHHYKNAGSHNALLTVANTAGASSSMQFASVAMTNYTPPTSAAAAFSSSRTVFGLYGLYITALSVTGIIWLEARHTARYATVPIE